MSSTLGDLCADLLHGYYLLHFLNAWQYPVMLNVSSLTKNIIRKVNLLKLKQII